MREPAVYEVPSVTDGSTIVRSPGVPLAAAVPSIVLNRPSRVIPPSLYWLRSARSTSSPLTKVSVNILILWVKASEPVKLTVGLVTSVFVRAHMKSICF